MRAPYRAKIPTMTGAALEQWTERLAVATSVLGRRVDVDGVGLLVERREVDGLREPATRLLRCADGWVAVSLAREWDREAMPAWVGVEGSWDQVAAAVEHRTGAELIAGAEMLGLAVGVLGERTEPAVVQTSFECRLDASSAYGVTPVGGLRSDPSDGLAGTGPRDHSGSGSGQDEPDLPGSPSSGSGLVRVLDLSALWAGPLCAALLAEAGTDVVKLESTARPDASRAGNPGLFARLNHLKRSVVLDLGEVAGRSDLASLVRAADVVVESSRPRALEQMGIVAAEVLADPTARTRVWVSITGHGRTSNRAGFGDDAAVAGGLVRWDDGVPALWGDAAADPLTGLVSATLAAEALVSGRRVLLDVALAGVAADLRDDLMPDLPDVFSASDIVSASVLDPTQPTSVVPAVSPLGCYTAEVLAEWVGS